MKKPLVFLSFCSFFSAPLWAKVDCYDVKALTFSTDHSDQKGFTCPLSWGEQSNKEDRKKEETTAYYAKTLYKLTGYDTSSTSLDRISTSEGQIATYTERMASLINSLRAYAIVSDRKLCFDTKSYTQPMTTLEQVKGILSVEGGVPEIRIPTKRLSIKNTKWKNWVPDAEDETKERAYSYQGLVFDREFVLARFPAEIAGYVGHHLKKERWWMIRMQENSQYYHHNFTAFMNSTEDCQFSDEKYVYLADIMEGQPFVCGPTTLACSDPRHKKLLQLRVSHVTPGEYIITWNDRDPTLYLFCGGTLQTTLTEPHSLWKRLTARKSLARRQSSEAPPPELPPSYTATVSQDSK